MGSTGEGVATVNTATEGRLAPSRRVVLAALLALVSGAGGLLFEVVCLRRTALVVGYGSTSQAIVFAAFLLGLGLGGLWLPRRFAHAPMRGAATLWGLVAVLIVVLDTALGSFGSLGGIPGTLLAILVPFVVSVPMGGAFPLLFPWFTAAPPHGSRANGSNAAGGGGGVGIVQAANLLGSVAAAIVGAGYVVPEFGNRLSALIAAGAYAIVAGACFLQGRGVDRGSAFTDGMATTTSASMAARIAIACSGFAVLGLELWMPRRLVFALGSFLPTIVGSLVGVLCGLAIGSALVDLPSLRRRGLAGRAIAAIATLGVVVSITATELAIPWLADLVLSTYSSRLLAASVAPCVLLLPAAVPLGMILPLELEHAARSAHDGRVSGRDAGRAFFVFSVGALGGALVLPFVYVVPGALVALPALAILPLALFGILAHGRRLESLSRTVQRTLAIAAFCALPLATLPLAMRPALVGARNFDTSTKRVLRQESDRITTASVALDLARSELVLYTDEFSAAGGDRSGYMRALGLLAERFAGERGDRVVICLGTGTTAATLARASAGATVDIVEISPAVLRVSDAFVTQHEAWSKSARVHVTDGRHFVERAAPESLAALTLEPLLPQAPGSVHLYSVEFYRAVFRALREDGVCVQWLPTHALDPEAFAALLASFCDVFGEVRCWLFDESTLIVGGKRPLTTKQLPPASDLDSWICGTVSEVDWSLAELPRSAVDAVLRSARERVVDDRPFLERRAFAPGVEVLGWLPATLERFAASMGEARDTLEIACQARMQARVALARSVLEPGQLDVAVARIRDAMRLVPDSLLLDREAARIRAAIADREGLVALAKGAFGTAASAFGRAIEDGGANALRDAGLVACESQTGRVEAAIARIERLRALGIDVRSLPSVVARRDRGFACLFEDARLEPAFSAMGSDEAVDHAVPDPRRLASALERGETWAEDFLRHRPIEARFRLAESDLSLELAERVVPLFETRLLARLERWVRVDPARRLPLLARRVPKRRPKPQWWRDDDAALDAWKRASDPAVSKIAWQEVVRRYGLEGDEAIEPRAEADRLRRAAVLTQRFSGR